MDAGRGHLGRFLLAGALGLLACAGCQNFRPWRIDPTGRQIFIPPEAAIPPAAMVVPGVPLPQERVTLAPREMIAPVGTEVVLQAGVDGRPTTFLGGERIEWMLSPESAGDFITLGNRDQCCLFRLPKDRPRKVSNKFAIGATLSAPTNISRGTVSLQDDLTIGAGRSWITVSSPLEGTSQVTAFAPGVANWENRTATATIHWVDAQWVLPPPAINPVGTRHTLTTTVMRQTDSSPLEGYQVRYEVLDGPPAGFAPNGDQVLVVPTNGLGQASIELKQTDTQAGTNRIGIQIIRPSIPGTAQSKSLLVGCGTTTKTWTSPDLAVRCNGPTQAALGGRILLGIEVANPGDLPVRDVTLTAQTPRGTSYIASSPQASVAGQQIQWSLGELAPRERRTFELQLLAEQIGAVNSCVEVRSAEGLSATSCAATTIAQAQLEASLTGPASAAVGSTVRFRLLITNRGSVPATGVHIRNQFDAGFEHLVAPSPIERDLEDIPAGQAREIMISLRVVQPGRLCQRVDVTGNGGLGATAEACLQAERIAIQPEQPPVEVNPQPAPFPGPRFEPAPRIEPDPRAEPQPRFESPPRPQPQPQPEPPVRAEPGRAAIEVDMTGPRRLQVGELADFAITIRNTGQIPLTDLRVVDAFDRSLEADKASDGFQMAREGLVWTLPRLEVGQPYLLQLRCRCVAPATSACNRVSVACREHAEVGDQACLEIVPAPTATRPRAGGGRLRLSIAGLDQPVAVGGKARYRVFVTNDGSESDTNVRLVVNVPAQMSALPDGTKAPVRATFPGRRIVFEPVAELRAGESLTFEIQTQAQQAGNVSVVAELTSDAQAVPLSKAEETEILGR